MTPPAPRLKLSFQILGICSPYIAVIGFVFMLRNLLLAVGFYHVVLLICILAIRRTGSCKRCFKPFHWPFGLIGLGGIVPGLVILYAWPLARLEHVNLADLMATLNINKPLFIAFSIYACLVNPLLEEGFWRGCFDTRSIRPNAVDLLFAGYHALAVSVILKPLFVVLILLAMTFAGWLFRMLYRGSGSLLPALFLHLAADIAILYAIWKLIE